MPDQDGEEQGGSGLLDGVRRAATWNASFTRWLSAPFFLRAVLPFLAVVIAIKLLIWSCFTYVGPNQFGIKIVRVPVFGGGRGAHREVYDPGYHVVLKAFGLEEMYFLPRDVQVLDLTGSRAEACPEAQVTKAARTPRAG